MCDNLDLTVFCDDDGGDGDEQELSEVVREFRAEGGKDSKGPRGENKVLYDDFVDMLVVGSPRCVACCLLA